MKEIIIIILLVILLVAIFIFLSTQAKSEKRKIYLVSKQNKTIEITAEIADSHVARMRGLMFRSFLPENGGMLFVFPDSDYRSFWMVNTTIPLDAIFISETGKIIDIQQMNPCKTLADYCRTYRSHEKAMYVLEVNQGFSDKHNLSLGSKLLFEN